MSDELNRTILLLREKGLEMQAMGRGVKRNGGESKTKRSVWRQFRLGNILNL